MTCFVSQRPRVEAVAGQSKEDFIPACENAFYFYGGVPQAVVPDNLKAAVTRASRHESILNGVPMHLSRKQQVYMRTWNVTSVR